MTELAPYPEYKDSGVEWLGETPSHWGRAQLRRVATIVNGGTPTPDEAHWGGSVAWATPVDLNTVDGHTIKSTLRTLTMEGLASGSALVPSGSVILSTRAPIGYSAMTRSPVAFNQGCKGLILTGNIDSRFMLVTVQAAKAELARRGQGTTFLELSSSALGSVNVPLVPLEEQLAIADFVERETAEIDAFIADQEELIGLLIERRAATITHAVTRGLDPSAPMKDSGIEWLGEVPAHWAVGRIGSSVASTKNGVWGDEPGSDDDIRCVRVADFDRPLQRVHDRAVTYRAITTSEREGRVLRRGDLLLEKSGGGEKSPVGFVVLYDRDEPAVTSNFVARVQLRTGMDPHYWTYVHGSNYGRRLTARSVKQSTGIQNLDQSSYFSEAAPLPPSGEQSLIADYLDHETAEIDATIADAREAIALSKERRAALISAAVTGKIDVRGLA